MDRNGPYCTVKGALGSMMASTDLALSMVQLSGSDTTVPASVDAERKRLFRAYAAYKQTFYAFATMDTSHSRAILKENFAQVHCQCFC